MSISDWLIEKIEQSEESLEINSNDYMEGRRDAYRSVLNHLLSEVEHDTTLREFKEFCKTHKQCSRCSVVDTCRFDCPRIWDVEEMERRMKWEEERRMKEARND